MKVLRKNDVAVRENQQSPYGTTSKNSVRKYIIF